MQRFRGLRSPAWLVTPCHIHQRAKHPLAAATAAFRALPLLLLLLLAQARFQRPLQTPPAAACGVHERPDGAQLPVSCPGGAAAARGHPLCVNPQDVQDAQQHTLCLVMQSGVACDADMVPGAVGSNQFSASSQRWVQHGTLELASAH